MKKLLTLVLLSAIVFTTGNLMAQNTNYRSWWNSLSPEWKKIFQEQELKGKDVDPTDEQLRMMVNIQNLSCAGHTEITDIRAIAGLPELRYLDVSGTSIKSLQGINKLKSLKYLNCSDNDNLTSLAELAELTELEELNCGNTMVKDLTPIAGLAKLKKLDVHYCTINRLAAISNLSKLEELDVSKNPLFSLDGLQKNSLVSLNCSETRVSDLLPLQYSKMLAYLNISHTDVATIRPLQNVRTLREIDCSDSRITAAGLDYLYAHTSLTLIRARNINISAKEITDFTTSYKGRNTSCDIIITGKK
ncbi:MAG: leucine-rich repeat domain-containing protein [Bacteroidales bacterium]|nr:leucine-rich repeat domain-containing protein [Bacteroidales bacterium]